MAALVTLADAKAQLRVTINDDDAAIYQAVEDATAIIVEYLKAQADPTWTLATVPGQVRRAILLWVTHLREHPGDDMKTDAEVWQATRRLLERSRDPALA